MEEGQTGKVMEPIRKPFQGVWNVVRFNWHSYLLAFLLIACLLSVALFTTFAYAKVLFIATLVILFTTLVSLGVSWFVYDYAGLFRLHWLEKCTVETPVSIVNINAGFDEFSALLRQRFPASNLRVFDFFDALGQKEVSVKRARKAYPAYVLTENIALSSVPVKSGSADVVFLLLAAHEIREDKERILFFKELQRILKPGCEIVIVEHTRDICNFLAYNIGFFHFHSKRTWLKTFIEAGFMNINQHKITPFLTLFILKKNGNSF